MNNQYKDGSTNIDQLAKENLLIKEKLELLSALFDDLSKMYFKLEGDLFLTGKISKKYSDEGTMYDIYKDS